MYMAQRTSQHVMGVAAYVSIELERCTCTVATACVEFARHDFGRRRTRR